MKDLSRFNSTQHFEIEVSRSLFIDITDVNGLTEEEFLARSHSFFMETALVEGQSIKLYDYTHRPSKYFGYTKNTWENYAKGMSKNDGGLEMIFSPDNDGYHVQFIATKNIDKHRDISTSIKRIREEVEKIKLAISKMKLVPDFDINRFLCRDDLLIALNRTERFDEMSGENITMNLASLPGEAVQAIVHMENQDIIDHLQFVRTEFLKLQKKMVYF